MPKTDGRFRHTRILINTDMNIKRLFLTTLTAACLSQAAVAVPAYPGLIRVTQADGTELLVRLQGDEHGHITLSEDGHPLFFNQQTQNYEYATLQQGRIAGSGIVATAADKRPADARAFLYNMQDAQAIFSVATAERQERLAKTRQAQAQTQTQHPGVPRRLRITDFPTVGEQHSLVILVEFSDLAFTAVTDASTYFTNLLNEEGFTYSNGANGSARDFYVDSSNGLFKPTFDVVGPVKLPKSYAYYGYGYQDDMERLMEFVEDAIKAADPVVDFSQYDTNNDGIVDNVYFFYAGKGEADGGSTNTIWPHAFSWQEYQTYYGAGDLTVDGKEMGSYSCSNEINGSSNKVEGIGTFVHEFGHVLGLCDHYDITYGTASYGYTPGSWDTMDQGSYNNNKNTPPAFSAYERASLDWLDYTELSTQTDTVTVVPNLSDSNKAYVVRVPDKDNEFFVLENRQQTGWDEYLPGHGMLVWHIDENETAWTNNSVNTNYRHQRIDIVEASGSASASSTAASAFPGTKGVTQFTFEDWSGSELFGFDDVVEKDDGNVTFVLSGASVKLASPAPITFTDVADSTLTASWTAVKDAAKYIVTVTDADGNVLPDYNAVEWPYNNKTLTNLTPETTYTVAVKAALGNYRSEEATATVTTTAIPFEKLRPDTLVATAVTSDALTAHWSAVRDAQSYTVTLSNRLLSSETSKMGYDFSDKAAGMPALWQTTSNSYASSNGFFGEASPSLRLGTSGDNWLLVAYPDAKIYGLSFWHRIVASNSSAGSMLYVERFADGKWLAVDSIEAAATSGTLSYEFEGSDSVRIRFFRKGGYMALDDVYATCRTVVRTPLSAYGELNVGNVTDYNFTGLEPGKSYSLTVVANQNGSQSRVSDELVVTTLVPEGISGLEADGDAPAAVYDLQGRRVHSPRQGGVYLIRQGGKTTKKVFTNND